MRLKAVIVAALGATLMCSCVTPSDPIAMGNGSYMLGVNARGGFQSNNLLLSRTIERANNFCSLHGKTAEVESAQATGVQGWTAQDSQVVFRCVEAEAPPA